MGRVSAGAVLNAAEIAFRAYADAIILIGELKAGAEVKVEALNTSVDAGEILKTTVVGTPNTVTWYLADSDAPGAWKRGAACDHC